MAHPKWTLSLAIFSIVFALLLHGAWSTTTFTFVNKCDYTVWPGILSNAGQPPLSPTGFVLQNGESRALTAPTSWGGRFWGRTYCSDDPSTGKFSCLTGDCGSGKLECSGNGATPPATLAEFTLNGAGGLDFFDVSLVDGYNLPMQVVPQGGSGKNCASTGCPADLNTACPKELRVLPASTGGSGSEGIACMSACEAFQQPQYCCSGAYNTPKTCSPSSYSELFKSACPRAYSYAYDDSTSTFTCSGADYTITFCPSPNTSQKSSSSDQTPATGLAPSGNSTMVYEGAMDISGSLRSPTALSLDPIMAGVVGTAVAVHHLCRHF